MQCDCTCKNYESEYAKITLSSGDIITMHLPLCRKFSYELAIIKCEHYEMR